MSVRLSLLSLCLTSMAWAGISPSRLEVNLGPFPVDGYPAGAGGQPWLGRAGAIRGILGSLAFEENRGQFDRRVRFVLRSPQYTAFFLQDRVTIGFRAPNGKAYTTSMRLNAGSPSAKLEGLDAVPVQTNYLRGASAARWVRSVRHYARIRYRGVYPGIDLVFWRSPDTGLEYDWVVAPGGNAAVIRTTFDKAAQVRLEPRGDLVVEKQHFEWRHRKPLAYQTTSTGRSPVDASFRLARGVAGFGVSNYDHAKPLVIDPVVLSAITFGGTGIQGEVGTAVNQDAGNAVALGPANGGGLVYVAGIAVTLDFPRNNSKFGVHYLGADAFVASVGAQSGLLTVYFLGGSGNDAATGIAVDPQGNVYATGYTSSADFPLVNAADSTQGGAFVAKFSPDFSSLIYSTYVAAFPAELSTAIAVDSTGNAYVTGQTTGQYFTATAGAFQLKPRGASPTAFVLKLDPTGKPVYATFLGGSLGDQGTAITVDAASNVYITGLTASNDFPVTPAVIEPACSSCGGSYATGGAFVTKLNPSGTGLVYSTYLGGGSGAVGAGIALDAAGNIYVAGEVPTPSPALPGVIPFPTTPGAFQHTTQAGGAAFIAKLNTTASSLIYSTLLAGPSPAPSDSGSGASALAVDTAGSALVTGWTAQADFPLVKPLQTVIGSQKTCASAPVSGGGTQGALPCGDAFVSKLSTDGTALEWSTYLGGSDYDAGRGIAVSNTEEVFVTGVTASTDFPASSVGHGSVFLVRLGQTLDAPGISAAGVTNAASFVTGLVPGGLATIFGVGFTQSGGVATAASFPLPLEIGGVFVTVDRTSAPLLAVTNQQVNFVVPWSVSPPTASVTVTVHGPGFNGFTSTSVSSIPVQAPVLALQPAIYLTDGAHAAAQHGADYSLIDAAHPAAPGEAIVLYVNGLGPVQPAVDLGAPAPSTPPAQTVVNPVVTIGGLPSQVLFSGLTPGFASLYQLNVVVPQAAQPGDQAVLITVQTPQGPQVSNTAKIPVL
jgi:uncharacterized protein (TIGR03437 family)